MNVMHATINAIATTIIISSSEKPRILLGTIPSFPGECRSRTLWGREVMSFFTAKPFGVTFLGQSYLQRVNGALARTFVARHCQTRLIVGRGTCSVKALPYSDWSMALCNVMALR